MAIKSVKNQSIDIGKVLGVLTFLVVVGCCIRSGMSYRRSLNEYCDKVGGRLETYTKGYSYSQDKDGSGSGSTDLGYQVRLPDNSVMTDIELDRRGLLRHW